MKRNKLYGLVLFLIVSFTNPFEAHGFEEITGKVVSVIDGNTVEVANENSHTVKVILSGIDSPEIGQDYGDKAKFFLEKMVLNKMVKVKIEGKDRRGNYLGIITINDDDPRISLLKEGLAWTAEKNPVAELEPYKTWAKKKGKGLWKDPNPTPPWTYKRQQTMLEPKSR